MELGSLESTTSAPFSIPDDGPSSSPQGRGSHESAVSNELSRAADNDIEEMPDHVSKGANPGTRTGFGNIQLHQLVISGASEDALRDVLKTMTREQIDSLDGDQGTALSIAVDSQDIKAARVLLEHNASPSREREQFPPLNRACYLGSEDMARLLIGYKPNLETRDLEWNFTPLEHAIREASKPLVNLLLDEGADINAAEDSEGWTPLMTACLFEKEEIVELLVNRGADVKKPKRDGVTPLHVACRSNLQKSVEVLIGAGADANAVDNYKRTPLYTASGYVDVAVVKLLQKQNVDINAASNKGRTPLAKAVRRGNHQVVDLLIKAKADVNIADNNGWTPLIVAICRRDDHIVKQLLAQDTTDVNKPENEGWTPLMLASVAGDAGYVTSLLGRNASVNVANRAGRTALHKASSFGNGEVVRLLLQRGRADPTKVDEDAQTALHKASRRGYPGIVEQLLSSMKDGANTARMINMADKDGWTALHYASCHQTDTDDCGLEALVESDDRDWILGIAATSSDSRSKEEVVRRLLAHGANAAAKDKDSQTPLHLAASSVFYKEIIEPLMENMDWGDIFATNAKGETAVSILAKEMAKRSQVPLDDSDDIEDQALGLAAENRETHGIARALLKKDKRAAAARLYLDIAEDQSDWNALDWAAYTGNDRVVWRLLCSMEPTRENDGDRERALRVATKVKDKLEDTAHRGRILDMFFRKWEDKAVSENANPLALKTDEYEKTVDLLRDPPFVPTSLPSKRIEKPKPKPMMSVFDAVIADFFVEGSQTGFLRRVRRVKQVICEGGPRRIMTEARKLTNATNAKLNKAGGGKVLAENDFRFRWVHLPANNDLVIAIGLEEERNEDQLAPVMSFFKKSWQEIPHRSSRSRLMKPHCVMERSPWTCAAEGLPESQQGKAPGDTVETHEDLENMMAIYMPYIRFGRIEKNARGDRNYQQLLDAYADQTIHGTRTLDEFYYHTAGDHKLEKDMKRRNQDQVVTKELDDVENPELKSWTILRIDELWVWVINKVLHYQDERRSTTNREYSQQETEELVNSPDILRCYQKSGIVTSCGTHYMIDQPGTDVYIFEQAIKEAGLFESFTKDDLKEQAKRGQTSNNERPSTVGATADLLCLIKDIRDELRILRALAGYQKTVQDRLSGKNHDAPHSADYIIGDIDEMDRFAKGIHAAFRKVGISIPIWIGCLLYAYWGSVSHLGWLGRGRSGGGGGGTGDDGGGEGNEGAGENGHSPPGRYRILNQWAGAIRARMIEKKVNAKSGRRKEVETGEWVGKIDHDDPDSRDDYRWNRISQRIVQFPRHRRPPVMDVEEQGDPCVYV
ncbi:Ankyrin-3 [Madurella mycetomatis]|uniref:Ankyrin-3 n=1 Tax=Madurella mycetomatis TaxID=100816 RepID=A0A175W1R7_9PEZI|nr:Ankyrin-3 [Madurella mycetomatis]KXX78997.1 Ankyrin-3 [Madurella mycetomatis]